jgi:hypothetical protein
MQKKIHRKKGPSRQTGRPKSISRKERIPNSPPALLATPALGHKFQFTASAALTSVPITRFSLLNLIMVATGATSCSSIIAAIKIRRVRLWAPILSTYVPQTALIEWNGGLYAPSTIHSDISEGLEPAKVGSVPPQNASASFWSLTGASNTGEVLFSLTLPQNGVVQLEVSMRIMDDEPAPTIQVVAGATAGKTYYGYLDGPPLTALLAPSGGVAVVP